MVKRIQTKTEKKIPKENNKIINVLKLNINLEGFKLELVSDDPIKTLQELNKLVNLKKELVDAVLAQAPLDYADYDDEDLGFDFEVRKLSLELKNNKSSMEVLRNHFLKHGKFLYRKESFDSKQEVDINNKKCSVIIDKNDLSMLMKKSLFGIKPNKIKQVFIHIISDNFTKEHESYLVDELKKRIGLVDVTFFYTPKKLNGSVVSETIIFGDFQHTPED